MAGCCEKVKKQKTGNGKKD
jgi:hypothetical protein